MLSEQVIYLSYDRETAQNHAQNCIFEPPYGGISGNKRFI